MGLGLSPNLKKMFKYFKSLVQSNTGNSSKSFGLVISAMVGALMGIAVTICLIWDVAKDGVINTNLSDLGIFVLCVGAYTFGSGANKMLSEIGEDKAEIRMLKEKLEEQEDET